MAHEEHDQERHVHNRRERRGQRQADVLKRPHECHGERDVCTQRDAGHQDRRPRVLQRVECRDDDAHAGEGPQADRIRKDGLCRSRSVGGRETTVFEKELHDGNPQKNQPDHRRKDDEEDQPQSEAQGVAQRG